MGQLGPEQPLFGGSTSALQVLRNTAPVYPASSWLQQPPSPGPSTIGLEMMDLELLHHFTTSTCLTMTTDEGIREIYRLAIPRIALSHEILMHALLAMSALHLSVLRSSGNSYAAAAAEHHSRAVGLLRTAFPVRDTEHGNAIFVTSSLTAHYAYACRPGVDGMLPTAPAWVPLFRGIPETIHGCWDWLYKGEIAPMWIRKDIDQSRYVEDIEFQSSLLDLSRRGAPGELDPEELEDDHVLGIYRDEMVELKNSWLLFRTTEPRVSSAFDWPCNMSLEFVQFIKERRPRALVMLAHHCVLVESIEDQYWWAKGRGADELRRIEGVLDEKWKHWLDWPMAKCKVSTGPG